MNKIRIRQTSQVAWPIATPIGVTEKRFQAVIPNYNKLGVTLLLEIEIRDASQKNGNRIVVQNLLVNHDSADSNGITGEILRKIPVQKLAEDCVRESVRHFYPDTARKGKTSLKVPSSEDVSRTQLVALTSQSLGIKASTKEIQEALEEQGISLEVGTIRNYLTKAKKAGLFEIESSEPFFPNALKNLTPDSLSAEGDLIDRLLREAAEEGRPPISPIEYRRRQAAAKELADARAAREAQIRKIKRAKDISEKNSPTKGNLGKKKGRP